MNQGQKTIFIFSLEPWGNMWYSKQHYAASLAKDHCVYFINPPKRWNWLKLFSFRAKVRSTPEGVGVVDYHNNLPYGKLPKQLARWRNRLNARKIGRLPRTGDVLFWCFYPVSLVFEPPLRNVGRVIYHVVDPYHVFANDPAFARSSDLVVAINPWYKEHYLKFNPNTIQIPHGVRTKDLEHDPAIVRSLRAEWGQYLILAANINRFTNYPLLLKIALQFPSLNLVLAGPLSGLKPGQELERERLLAMPNVVYAGILHPDNLRNLIKGALAGLVTYDFEVALEAPEKAGRTPLKVITYLTQLCPVVSTNNSFAPNLEGYGHFKAGNEEQFLTLIGQIVNGKRTVDRTRVLSYLNSVHYDHLIATILNKLPAPSPNQGASNNGPKP